LALGWNRSGCECNTAGEAARDEAAPRRPMLA